MIRLALFLWATFLGQSPQSSSVTPSPANQPLEKSAYFAFVDHDYIFTIEIVKPGVPLLNFVSMTDQDVSLPAKNIRLTLENRKIAAKVLSIETGNFQQPMSVTALAIHPRSSFGVRIDGDFGDAKELYGASIRIGSEDFKLVPLTSFDFEGLVLKVNRLNLGSPDFSDDRRVLRLEPLGSRSAARR
jgi:hypothetical protein